MCYDGEAILYYYGDAMMYCDGDAIKCYDGEAILYCDGEAISCNDGEVFVEHCVTENELALHAVTAVILSLWIL